MDLKRTLASLPILPRLGQVFGGGPLVPFDNSAQYWEQRYAAGGNSGAGSYGRLAEFKAAVLNGFVAEQRIQSVLELGCGDGAQLALACYPDYVGVDVSQTAVDLCRARFRDDPDKRFVLAGSEDLAPAELTLSLDVIYHLVEDVVFDSYMAELFGLASRFVGIYSSNHDDGSRVSHVRHRPFADWIDENASDWRLLRKVGNAFPFDAGHAKSTSFADFHFFTRRSQSATADYPT